MCKPFANHKALYKREGFELVLSLLQSTWRLSLIVSP